MLLLGAPSLSGSWTQHIQCLRLNVKDPPYESPVWERVSQHLHGKHGLSQAKLAEGIRQDLSIIGKLCKGERLHSPQARERVCAIIGWLRQQAVLTTVDEANGLLIAAGMAPLRMADPSDAQFLHQLHAHVPAPALLTTPRKPFTSTPRTNCLPHSPAWWVA